MMLSAVMGKASFSVIAIEIDPLACPGPVISAVIGSCIAAPNPSESPGAGNPVDENRSSSSSADVSPET